MTEINDLGAHKSQSYQKINFGFWAIKTVTSQDYILPSMNNCFQQKLGVDVFNTCWINHTNLINSMWIANKEISRGGRIFISIEEKNLLFKYQKKQR